MAVIYCYLQFLQLCAFQCTLLRRVGGETTEQMVKAVAYLVACLPTTRCLSSAWMVGVTASWLLGIRLCVILLLASVS